MQAPECGHSMVERDWWQDDDVSDVAEAFEAEHSEGVPVAEFSDEPPPLPPSQVPPLTEPRSSQGREPLAAVVESLEEPTNRAHPGGRPSTPSCITSWRGR